jgi:hypothetical protein
MPEPAPISFHLALYRYWSEKRGKRVMAARGDIDPAEIPALLPYISLVHKVEGKAADVGDDADLLRRCLDWGRNCLNTHREAQSKLV